MTSQKYQSNSAIANTRAAGIQTVVIELSTYYIICLAPEGSVSDGVTASVNKSDICRRK